jgi:hypothetical protein
VRFKCIALRVASSGTRFIKLAMDFLLLLGVSRHPRRLGAAVVLSSGLEIVSSLTK